MKTRFWKRNWFAGLAITIVVVVSSGSANMQSLERAAYDWGVQSTTRTPSEKIAIIAIDDESIANIGRWPWPRNLHAELVKKLADGGAKIEEWEVCCAIGKQHSLYSYLGSESLMSDVRRYTFQNSPTDVAEITPVSHSPQD